MKRINNNTSIASHNGVTGMRDNYLANMARTGIIVLAWTLVMVFLPRESSAQSATVTGKVTDVQTGQPLPGAKVDIESAGLSEIADENGRFVLRRVPSGNHTLSIHYLGYESESVSVSVSGGQSLEQDIELQSEFPEGDKIFVQADHWGQSRALNSQHQSATIKSTVTSEQMDRFTDYTISDAIIRAPGVQTGARGEISIRGIGVDRYKVTLDGQPLATTGRGSRSFDLGMISSGLVRDAEVIKVVTPDMDADAMTGVINLNTYNPVGGQRSVDIRVGGGANTQYFNFTGPESNASFYYTEPITDQLALAVNLNYQQTYRSWESLGIDYQVNDFEDGAGPVDVLERVSPGLFNDGRSTTGGGLQLAFQPTNRDNYHLRGFINHDNREIVRHVDHFIANRDWISQDTTGAEGGIGVYSPIAASDQINTRHYTLQAGGRHLFDLLNLEYNVGWSSSSVDREELLFSFGRRDVNFALDMEDRSRPSMQVLDQRLLLTDGTMDRLFIIMGNTGRVIDDHVDNTYSGKFDIEIPFGLGSLKLGSSAKLTNKTGEYDEISLAYTRQYQMTRFGMLRSRDVGILDQHIIPWFIDTDAMRIFFDAQRPIFTNVDPNMHRRRSDIWNYEVAENIYGGYGMATLEFGAFTLLGGARIEYTDSRFEGIEISFDDTGVFETSNTVNTDDSYMHLLPHAQIGFTPGNMTKINLAYSQSISRPDFNQISPFELASRSDSTLFRGNPIMEPVTSNNLDLQIEQSMMNLGRVSVGLFYKEISNIVALEERTINVVEGDFAGFDPAFEDGSVTSIPVRELMFRNSESQASVYGVELSWQQNLSFLPGLLSNLGTYANYTWSESIYDIDERTEDVTLPYQSPHVVNAALDYTQGRFFTQVAYHWTAESLVRLGSDGLAPSVSGSQSVYLDQYQDGWTDLSVSFRFRISENFRFWADAFNLLGNERVRYQHTREFYPMQIDKTGRGGFRAGIRYSL